MGIRGRDGNASDRAFPQLKLRKFVHLAIEKIEGRRPGLAAVAGGVAPLPNLAIRLLLVLHPNEGILARSVEILPTADDRHDAVGETAVEIDASPAGIDPGLPPFLQPA